MRKLRLSEVLVMVALAAIFATLFVVKAANARSKAFEAMCLSNLKQWGLAIAMYADDHNGTYFYGAEEVGWDSDASPYLRYFGGGNQLARIRVMRSCPARRRANAGEHDYSMPAPMYAENGSLYQPMETTGRFWDANGNIWPTLHLLRKPSQYLVLIDSSGQTLTCGGLTSAVTGRPAGDPVRAIDRHAGGANCLFGDFHAERVSYQTIVDQDAKSCVDTNSTSGFNWWFAMN